VQILRPGSRVDALRHVLCVRDSNRSNDPDPLTSNGDDCGQDHVRTDGHPVDLQLQLLHAQVQDRVARKLERETDENKLERCLG